MKKYCLSVFDVDGCTIYGYYFVSPDSSLADTAGMLFSHYKLINPAAHSYLFDEWNG